MPDSGARRELPEGMLDDMTVLVSNAEQLAAIVKSGEFTAASIHGLGKRIAAALNLPPSEVQDVLHALWRTKRYQGSRSTAGYLDWITAFLEESAPDSWKKDHFDSWVSGADSLGQLLDVIDGDHPIMIATKARVLAYTHQNLLLDSRIITDTRPIFDTTGEKIRELVVTHMLTIEYTDGRQEPALFAFAMDSRDITNLLEKCQRAITKSKAIKELMSSFNPIELPEEIDEE